ncbi:hypothetical protein F1188_06285 [Roseospira marina]|uniref:Uncharacterized protein n=1 Tax=Roseospira marina TaxID=140057 RepID=A0A5M6IFE6_9PROT|nr:hypothetical protein [Roseospira marina]KAA5606469.1 hypothetical protein F1188_06285 [Roseospira marina]MBB4314111.1 hypothetical protein [Roseospira marina]MBB5087272.1 hypothetical protein [Roseospira marina]
MAALTTPMVGPAAGPVSAPSASRPVSAPRAGGTGAGGLAEMIEAVAGAGAPRARTTDDDRAFADADGRGDGLQRRAARSLAPHAVAGEADGGPARRAVTPFMVDMAIKAVNAVVSGAPRVLVPGTFDRVTGVYDQAIQAIAGRHPVDLTGRALDRTL